METSGAVFTYVSASVWKKDRDILCNMVSHREFMFTVAVPTGTVVFSIGGMINHLFFVLRILKIFS